MGRKSSLKMAPVPGPYYTEHYTELSHVIMDGHVVATFYRALLGDSLHTFVHNLTMTLNKVYADHHGDMSKAVVALTWCVKGQTIEGQ